MPKNPERTALQLRIGSWFNRRPTTNWTEKEKKALKNVHGTPEEDMALIESYYLAKIPPLEDFRRHDLVTLLNNWPGEIDRARRFMRIWEKKRDLGRGHTMHRPSEEPPTAEEWEKIAETGREHLKRLKSELQ